MTVAYSHTTAQDIYRLAAAGFVSLASQRSCSLPSSLGSPIQTVKTESAAWTEVSERDARQQGIVARPDGRGQPLAYMEKEPLTAIVFGKENLRRNKLVACRFEPALARVPAFWHFGGTQYVVSPELLFVNMACVFEDEFDLAAFGCELCGYYSLLPHGLLSLRNQLKERSEENRRRGIDVRVTIGELTPAEIARGDGYVERAPLTSVARLREFILRYPNIQGRHKAHKALRWVIDGSNSPMETAAALFFHVGQRRGGFGLGEIRLNEKVPIKPEWQKVLNVRYLKTDEIFESRWGQKIAVEYQGWDWHTGRGRIVYDNRRRLALEDEGYTVFFITRADFENLHIMTMIANRIARILDLKPRSERPEILKKRRELHKKLIDPDLGR